MSITYNKVKSIIDTWDPIELHITHAPPNEYDYESREIFNAIKGFGNVEPDLAQIIFNTFAKEFGNDTFKKV